MHADLTPVLHTLSQHGALSLPLLFTHTNIRVKKKKLTTKKQKYV